MDTKGEQVMLIQTIVNEWTKKTSKLSKLLCRTTEIYYVEIDGEKYNSLSEKNF